LTDILTLEPIKWVLLMYFVYIPAPWLAIIGGIYLYSRYLERNDN